MFQVSGTRIPQSFELALAPQLALALVLVLAHTKVAM
jgi:hypothetical protein